MPNCIECVDHLGNEYNSIKEMCEHYGITKSAFDGRIKSVKFQDKRWIVYEK